jgi:uncharacterized protein involved in type VI secretion and phage assembly
VAIFGLASFFAQQIRTAEAEADRVYEAVIGIVVDIKDPEKQCRVKVRFPTLGPDSTWWCPVVALGAGADRGWFTLPEVDDEVVVGFEHGDLARPVVLGAIWNGKDRAPDANADGDNPRRVIRSKRGHTVTLDDKDGAIRLADGEGIATVTIAASAGVTLEAAQGDAGVSVVGLYVMDVDNHESAVMSAIPVGRRLSPRSPTLARLDAELAAGGTASPATPHGVPQPVRLPGRWSVPQPHVPWST